LDGSWIRRETKLNSGSRRKGHKVQSRPVGFLAGFVACRLLKC
jgi:hypothetical protein